MAFSVNSKCSFYLRVNDLLGGLQDSSAWVIFKILCDIEQVLLKLLEVVLPVFVVRARVSAEARLPAVVAKLVLVCVARIGGRSLSPFAGVLLLQKFS